MRRITHLLLCLTWSVPAGAQSTTTDPLDVVPLVDMNAPLVAAWFVAASDVRLEDASSVEQQVYQDFFKRMDVRVISREKTLELLGQANRPELLDCSGDEACLLQMGRVLEVDLIVGVILRTEGESHRLILKSIDLQRAPPAQLNSVVEGSLTDLLIGGIAGAVGAAFENRDQYMPLERLAEEPGSDRPAPKPPPAVHPQPAPDEQPIRSTAAAHEAYSGSARPGAATSGPMTVPDTPAAAASDETGAGTVTAAPDHPGFFERHLSSTLVLAGGVAALGTGITLGSMSADIASDMEVAYDRGKDKTGRDYALAANILFGVSGAAALTSLILFLFVEDDQPPPAFTVVPAVDGVQAVVRF